MMGLRFVHMFCVILTCVPLPCEMQVNCGIPDVDEDSIQMVPYSDANDVYTLHANVSWDPPSESGYDGYCIRFQPYKLDVRSVSSLECEITGDLVTRLGFDCTRTQVPYHTFFDIKFGYKYHINIFTAKLSTTPPRRNARSSYIGDANEETPDCYATTGDFEYCRNQSIQSVSAPANLNMICVKSTVTDASLFQSILVEWSAPIQIRMGAIPWRFQVLLLDSEEKSWASTVIPLSEDEIDALQTSNAEVPFRTTLNTHQNLEYALRNANYTLQIHSYVYWNGSIPEDIEVSSFLVDDKGNEIPEDTNGPRARLTVNTLNVPDCNAVWAEWSECSCDGPDRTRERVCTDIYQSGLKCNDLLTETERCTCVSDPVLSTLHIGLLVCGTAVLLAIVLAFIWRFCCKVDTEDEDCGPDETLIRDKDTEKDFGEMPKPVSLFEAYELGRKDLGIHLDKLLGSGAQGSVYKGKLRRDKTEWINVAVKTPKFGDLTSSPENENVRKTFMEEIRFSIEVQGKKGHPNILAVLGCCTLEEPYYLVTPFMKYGDLLGFVRRCKKLMNKSDRHLEDPTYNLTPISQLQIVRQVARGMEFLSSNRYYMGDLAASNVLVGEGLDVKIADFGLGVDLYTVSGDTVRQQDEPFKFRPRWVSLETYKSNGAVCNVKSDVWSFGILMYEVYTFGELPYSQKWSNAFLLRQLINGYRLEHPEDCQNEIYKVMRECWNEDPNLRPTFASLENKFNNLLNALTRRSSLEAGYIDALGSSDASAIVNPAFDSILEEEDEEDPATARYVVNLPTSSQAKSNNEETEPEDPEDQVNMTDILSRHSNLNDEDHDYDRIRNERARSVVSSNGPNSEKININDYFDYERRADRNELSGASNIDTRF